jgi:hypothetical protein
MSHVFMAFWAQVVVHIICLSGDVIPPVWRLQKLLKNCFANVTLNWLLLISLSESWLSCHRIRFALIWGKIITFVRKDSVSVMLITLDWYCLSIFQAIMSSEISRVFLISNTSQPPSSQFPQNYTTMLTQRPKLFTSFKSNDGSRGMRKQELMYIKAAKCLNICMKKQRKNHQSGQADSGLHTWPKIHGTLNRSTQKHGVFWDVKPCGSCKNRRFGWTQLLLHQGDKNRWNRNNTSCN